MELQIVLIGAVVFVVSAVVIYLISAFTMKEKTFEEVIAEQKRQQEAENQKAKQEKHEKKSDKDVRSRFKKKKDKGKGDGSPKVSDAEVTKETKMVEIELEPEIIEAVEDKPLKISKRKDKPIKSILHNKDEKTPVIKDSVVEDIVHRGPAPRDDIELKHLQESKKEKAKKDSKDKAKKESETKQAKQQPIVEEMMMVKETMYQSAAAPQSLESRTMFGKSDAENAKLISSVKSANLKDSDVQSLIETLLNKQGGSGMSADWNKKSQKGDPVTLLRKQLEEKERSLQEEQQMVMAANTKLKEIKQEMNQEKLKFQALEKSFKEKLDYQTREGQALQSRVQHAHEQHLAETSQQRAMIQKLEAQAGDQSRVQRLAEENKSLRESLAKFQSETVSPTEVNNMKQTLQIIQKELSSNATKLNASENSKKTLEQKLAKAEAELKKYESHKSSADSLVQQRVDEVNQELRKSEAKNSTVNKDLKKAEQALEVAHKECNSFKTKLQELEKSLVECDKTSQQMEHRFKEAEKHKLGVDGDLKNITKCLEDSDKEKADLKTQLQSMKQENNALSTELKTTRERQQGEGQEAPSKVPAGAQNGDVHEENTKEATIPKAEHDKILAEKVMKVHELTAEIENNKIEITNLQKDTETQKKKNNEELKTSLTEIEDFDKSVLQRLFPEVSVSKKSVHKDWVLEYEKQVTSYLASMKQPTSPSQDNSAKNESKINELESKSADLEKQLKEAQTKVSSLKELEQKSSKLEQQLKDSKGNQGNLQELQSRVSKLEKDLEAAESSRDSLQSRLEEAESSCNKSQSQISQYRNVLGETENKLTQLESSVETEEKKWVERLQAKELELEQTQQEVSTLRSEAAKSNGSQEMKERILDLESQLNQSEDRCSQLETQLKQAETKVTEYNVQIVELKTSSAGVSDINKELERIKKELQDEKKNNKSLASKIVILNGQLKSGVDALSQEQELVEALKTQLSAGDGGKPVPSDTNSEIKKAASQGGLDEAGTSV